MAFDKTKIKRDAERYLTQGRISAAIREYKKVTDNDPSDINTQNMLGDLYLKADDPKAAALCYQKVADSYNSSGFEKKAIAIYNKIYRLEPDSPEISIKLAELYQRRGSLAEAREHYDKVAKHYEENGKGPEALTIWEQIATISPKNTEIHLKIAEFYWHSSQKGEAGRAFIQAGTRLAELSKHEEAVAAFSRALEAMPEDLEAVRGFVSSQVSLGYPEEAVKILDDIYEKDPHNGQVVFLMVDCYLDMDNAQKSEIILVDLVTQDPKAYTKLLDLVDYYLKKDDLDSAIRILSMISEQLLVSQKPESLLDLLNEVITRNPEHIQALRLLTRYYNWHKDETELARVLEQLLDAANLNESLEDERYAITQLLLISPQEAKYITRLKEMNDFHKADSDVGVVDSDVAAETDKVPTFEAYEGLLNGNGSTADSGDSVVEYVGESASEEFAEIQLTEADLHTDGDEEDSEDVGGFDAEEQIENLKFYIEQGYVEIADHTLKELDEAHDIGKEFDEIRAVIKQARDEVDAKAKAEEDAQLEKEANEETEAAEVKTEVEETESKEVPEISAPEVSKAGPKPKEVDEAESQNTTENIEETDKEESAVSDKPAPDDQLIEVETEVSHTNVAKEDTKNDASGVEPESQASTESEEASLEVPTQTEQVKQVNPEPIVKNQPESASEDGSGDEVNKAEPSEKVSSVNSPEVHTEESESTNEEYETHYHHAVAYKEMGLLEDAIREFRNAVAFVTPSDRSGKFLQCCTLLGHCFTEQNLLIEAIAWFEKAFDADGLDDIEKRAIAYELGNVNARDGNHEKALALFEKIYTDDSSYRDVAERVRECKEKVTPVAA